jgi:simple sugar transport system permease protein
LSEQPPREPTAPPPSDSGLVPQPSPQEEEPALSLAAKMWLGQRAGGIAVPVSTAVVALLIGGAVVAATGHNPLTTYKDIFNGAGLNWFAHPTTDTFTTRAYNLSQTLLLTTSLTLTGLAVAFAFRCGMFNIGGQGQYFVGLFVAVWVGSSWAGMAAFPHVLIGIVAATLAGALWAGIAGLLKATVGAHEVITTIMLNWIAYWIGSYLFGLGGPLQSDVNSTSPISKDVVEGAKLPVFWGDQVLQGLHIGFFIAIAALVVFYLLLNRTTLGYEVRAVGFNPDAAHYGGISVRKNLIRAMAISGAFAGLAGGLDILGYLYRFGVSDIPVSAVGFLGIAVALLGRNTAVGVGLSAFLFAALLFGTSFGLSTSSEIPPELATNLTSLIQGLIVLFVGADVVILYIWNTRKRARRRQAASAPPTTSAAG